MMSTSSVKALFSAANAKTLTGYVHVEGAVAGTRVSLRIPEAGVDSTLQTDGEGRAAFEFKGRQARFVVARDAKTLQG